MKNSDADEDKPQQQKKAARKNKVMSLKNELKSLLSQPLVRRGISTKYITSGNRLDINDMLAGDCRFFFLHDSITDLGNVQIMKG